VLNVLRVIAWNCFSHVMPTQPLSGKAVLVTGGARRIGRGIALALGKAGADVAITYKTSQAEAAQTALEIEALGRRALAVECDVRSEASVRRAIAATVAQFGRLDVLVNNAAVFASAPLESISLDQWDAVFETNARGPFLVAREALTHLRAVHGRIVNIGSLGGIHAWAGHAHYCASKAALHMLTLAMAKAFAPEVSVNCVAPGWIELDDRAEDDARRFAARTPMKRNGTEEDVAQAVLFFATGPGFVTGQVLAVDGGLGLA
jgi:NAD(P)-dependent dehydrogenase (short-subunit alcohol dehydrogenase family)